LDREDSMEQDETEKRYREYDEFTSAVRQNAIANMHYEIVKALYLTSRHCGRDYETAKNSYMELCEKIFDLIHAQAEEEKNG